MIRFFRLLPALLAPALLGAAAPDGPTPDVAIRLANAFRIPAEFKNDFGDYRSPLLFNDGSPVRTTADWSRRRAEIRRDWTDWMGAWPAFVKDHELTVLESRRIENFTRKKITFRWSPTETTTAYLLVPDRPGKRPAVITVYYEPETAIGEGKELRDFALQLARRGFVTLSLGTSRTTANRTYANYWPSRENARVQPLSMLACVAANAWHLLAKHDRVDPDRIGITGHSYGGKWAMFASCLFERFACAAWSDPGIVFDDGRPSVNYWEPWYLGYEPPLWRKRGIVTEQNPATGLYPRLRKMNRDLHELHALMAPRPFLVSGGSEDPPARWRALNHSVAVNRLLGHSRRVGMTNRPKHGPTPESNAVIYRFFETVLKP